MRQKPFRFLQTGDQFYTKDRDSKIHKWIKLERTVNAYLSESPANVVNLESGKFGLVYESSAVTYPCNFKSNKTPSLDNMLHATVRIY